MGKVLDSEGSPLKGAKDVDSNFFNIKSWNSWDR